MISALHVMDQHKGTTSDLSSGARNGLAVAIHRDNLWGAISIGHALVGATPQLGSKSSKTLQAIGSICEYAVESLLQGRSA